MEVVHDTPFIGSLDAILDKDGSEARVALLKATYEITQDGSLRIAEGQEPIRLVDQYWGEEGNSGSFHETAKVVNSFRVSTAGITR